jgi:hypothetical protein
VPCWNGRPSDQFPKLHLLGFAASYLSARASHHRCRTHLTIVCSSGAKCFFAYSAGMLASTIARKSIPNVSYPSLVSQRVRMAYTFSNVGSVKLPREVQEVL